MFKWLRRRPVEDREYMHGILANHTRAFNKMHDEMVGLVKHELARRDAEIIKLRAQLAELSKEQPMASTSGWVPVEIDGLRCIRHPLNTRIDIKNAEGQVFSGVLAGSVSMQTVQPAPKKPSIFDLSLAPYAETWFGVVTHYRLHRAYKEAAQ